MLTIARDVAWTVAGALTLLFAGALVYLVVSFVTMLPHAEARGVGRTARAILAEALAIAVTQPLMPLFYVVGRRMGGPRAGRPIVFVHGYFQNRVDFIYLAHVLRRAAIGPMYGFNYDWRQGVTATAEKLARFVERVCAETGAPSVALVAHSLGGIVALDYVASPAGRKRVDRCVTIASPHAGVLWRGPTLGASGRELRATSEYMKLHSERRPSVPTLSIYSTHDNVVHPSATSALAHRGAEDHEVHGVGHLAILFSSEVARLTLESLTRGSATSALLEHPEEARDEAG